ncbi:hypothetical protein D2M30_2547 [Bacillus amyloliquefaciens]|nr:hypothetical protein D2M30_2547 [Bacillus amyloliquefaciens]
MPRRRYKPDSIPKADSIRSSSGQSLILCRSNILSLLKRHIRLLQTEA